MVVTSPGVGAVASAVFPLFPACKGTLGNGF